MVRVGPCKGLVAADSGGSAGTCPSQTRLQVARGYHLYEYLLAKHGARNFIFVYSQKQ